MYHRMNQNQNQNQRYEARVGFPGYEGSPYGIPRVEYAANLAYLF